MRAGKWKLIMDFRTWWVVSCCHRLYCIFAQQPKLTAYYYMNYKKSRASCKRLWSETIRCWHLVGDVECTWQHKGWQSLSSHWVSSDDFWKQVCKMTEMRRNYMTNTIMNVSGTLCQLIHYFPSKHEQSICHGQLSKVNNACVLNESENEIKVLEAI